MKRTIILFTVALIISSVAIAQECDLDVGTGKNANMCLDPIATSFINITSNPNIAGPNSPYNDYGTMMTVVGNSQGGPGPSYDFETHEQSLAFQNGQTAISYNITQGSAYVEEVGHNLRVKEGVATTSNVIVKFIPTWSFWDEWFDWGPSTTWSEQTITISFSEVNSVSASDITLTPNEICEDHSSSVTVKIQTGYVSSSTYRLYRNNGNTLKGTFNGQNFVIAGVDLDQFWDSGQGRYEFFVTEQGQYGLEQSVKAEKHFTNEFALPVLSGLTGENDVCQGDYTQTYSVSGAADNYNWTITNGTIQGASNGSSVSVLWDETQSSWNVSVYGDNNGCSGSAVNLPVSVRSDVNTSYTVGGTSNVCDGATGNITLSGSQGSYNYSLFQSNVEVPGSSRAGGSPITWTSMNPGTYEVRVFHSSACGWYSLGSKTINEYGIPSAPTSITGTLQACVTENISLTGNGGSANDWDWQYFNGSWSSNISGQNDNTLVHATVAGTTKYRARYNDNNGCESAWRERTVTIETFPGAPSISGLLTNICVDDEAQTYTISGGGDSFEWEATNGTPASGTGTTANITWDDTQSSWSIRARAINTNGAASCEGAWTTEPVTLRKDVQYFTAGGDDYVCNGGTGEVTLSDSENGKQYFLFQSSVQVPGSGNAGTGSSIDWPNMAPGTYEVRLFHGATCGYYSMGSHTINERSVPTAPITITGTASVCDGDVLTLSTSTGNSTTSWEWQEFYSGGWNAVPSESTNVFTAVVNSNATQVRARYYNTGNGISCPSAWRTKTITVIDVPVAPSISGTLTNICVGDEVQSYTISGSADSYAWSTVNGTPSSGTGTTANITWDDTKSTWSITAWGINSDGGVDCNGAQQIEAVTLRKDVTVYTVGGDDYVCNGDNGDVTLSDSQVGYDYFLYEGLNQVSGSQNPGSGSGLTWSNTPPGTYEVRASHPSCGLYSMGFHTINERTIPTAPNVITGTKSVCDGDQLNLSTSTSNSTTTWEWEEFYSSSWHPIVGETSNNLTASVNALATSVRARYYNTTNGVNCVSSWRSTPITVIDIPVAPNISGTLTNICVGDEVQSYTISGSADSYAWETTNGTPSSGTGTTANITWDETKSSWSIRAWGTNSNGGVDCDGPQTSETVTLRKDVNIYVAGGDDYVCNGDNGDVTLSDSQIGYDYYLFENSTEVIGSQKAGTGNLITWTNIPPGTYEVRADHPSCGWYVMSSHTMNERSVPSLPNVISGDTDVCDGELLSLTTTTASSTTSWEWQEFFSGGWNVIAGQTTNNLSAAVNANTSQVRVRYFNNDNGVNCESAWRTTNINVVAIPTLPVITGENDVCVGEEAQVYNLTGDATDYEWIVSNGTPVSGTGTSISVTWDDSQSSGWKLEARGINNDGAAQCEGAYQTFNVSLKKDVTVYTVSGTSDVCFGDNGSISLSNSQSEHDYALYDGGVFVPGTQIPGTDAALNWNGVAPGAYTVELIHAECSNYEMGSFTINEYSLPVAGTISGNTEFCLGENVNVTGSHVDAVSWEWDGFISGVWSPIAGQTTGALTFNAVTGLTQVRARYIDGNGCPSDYQTKMVDIEPIPGAPSISGTFTDICVDDEFQTYTVSGTGDVFEWEATNGTLSASTGTSVNVTWDETQSSWSLRARAVNVNGSASCESAWDTETVMLRNDVSFFTAAGDDYVCNGETGTVTLSGSQAGETYYLFESGVQVPASANAGTGSLISWPNMAPSTYEVRLLHPSCGWYVMSSHTINERAVPTIPNAISGDIDVCDGELLNLTTTTASSTTSWEWQEFFSGGWNTISGQATNNLTSAVNSNSSQVRVRYFNNDNGVNCESAWRTTNINVVAIPTLPVITGENDVCVGEEAQVYNLTGDATDYEWIVSNGTPVSGTGTSISVTWDDSQSSGWKLEARGINNDGAAQCEGAYQTFNVSLKKDVTVYTVSGTSDVCFGDNGSISLSNSQSEHDYALYQASTLVPGTQIPGTDAALNWNGVAPGAYTVQLIHAECSNYEMGSFTINEYSLPVAGTISGNTEFCLGENVNVTGSHVDAVSWEWDGFISGVWSPIAGQTIGALTFNAVTGLTQVRARYIDGNGCPSDYQNEFVDIEPIPGAPSISGTFTGICVDDEFQTYTVSGTGDVFEWEATNGTLSASTGTSVDVTWDETQSSWSLRARAVNVNGSASCEGAWTTETVTLRKDVEYFTAGGDAFVCNGETGTVTLSGSQAGGTYYLFESGIQVPGSANAGTGSLISWTSMAPSTYEARLLHSSCGWYVMSSHTIEEKVTKAAPTISGTVDVCDGDVISLTASTSNTSQSWIWSKFQSGAWSVLGGETTALMTNTVNTNITKYKAQYIDEFGCPSDEQEINVNIVDTPALPVITGENDVCVGQWVQDYSVSGVGDQYEWLVTNGTLNTNVGETVTVTWDETQTSGWKVEARAVVFDGAATCGGSYTAYDVVLRNDITFQSLTGDLNVCNGDLGSVSLSSSQNGAGVYVLYIDGVRSNIGAHAKVGTGSGLVWTDLSPNQTYTVILETSACGNFNMAGSVLINEYAKSTKPAVTTLQEVCSGQPNYDFTFTGPSDLDEFIIYDNLSAELGRVPGSSGSGTYALPVTGSDTDFRVSYIDANGCESNIESFSVEYVTPPTPVITGTNDVCQGAEDGNVYDAGVDAASYLWSVTEGTIVGGNTSRTVTVNWNPGATGAQVSVSVSIESSTSSISCQGSEVAYPVSIRNDINFFSVTGSSEVCAGETGSVTLSATEIGEVYVLYIDGVRSDPDARTGIGSAITWDNLAVDKSYEVYLETVDCGIYQMDFPITVTEYPVSTKPSVVTLKEVCGEGFYNYTFEGQTGAQQFFLYNEFDFLLSSGTAADDRATISISVTEVTKDFKVNYRDANGCISATTEFSIEVVDAPLSDGIEGEIEICQGAESGNVYDAGVVADSYSWSVAGGTIIGGSTGQTVTVDWTPGSSLASIEMTAFKQSSSGTITCEADVVRSNITIGNDIFPFDLSQSDFLCEESTGNLTLSGSQVGKIYVLYIDGARSNNAIDAKIGTGSQLEWAGLEPFKTYTVNLETLDCGNYPMDGDIVIEPGENAGGFVEAGEDLITTTPSGTVQTGKPVIFETPAEADGYSWSFTGDLVSSDERPVMIFNLPDTTIDVELTLLYDTGCEINYSFEDVITVEDTEGIFNIPESTEGTYELNIDVNGASYDLYPNPSDTEVNFRFTSVATENVKVIVTDLKQTIVNTYTFSVSSDPLNQETLTIPLDGIVPGLYVVKVEAAQFSSPVIIVGIKN